MNIHDIFNGTAIKDIEEEILFEQTRLDRSGYRHGEVGRELITRLLKIRQHLLNQMFSFNEEYKTLLVEFNEALKTELIDMRLRTIDAYNRFADIDKSKDYWATGKCFLGYKYSSIHPVQTMRAKKIWDVLNGSLDCYCPLYKDGIMCFGYEYRTPGGDSEFQMLYLEETIENWNDDLDQEATKDMNLIYPVHSLLTDMNFAMFDLLWVRDFNTEITVEIDRATHNIPQSEDLSDWSKFDY